MISRLNRQLLVLLLFVAGSISSWSLGKQQGNKLIVILMDGFRSDYLDKISNLKGFDRLRKQGVRASMMPDYPSISFPNYYSIMTGLHTESHGIVDNYMYDPIRNAHFSGGTGANDYDPVWWDGGEPVWITATRQGLRSAMFSWPGCRVKIRGLRPAFYQPYDRFNQPTLADFQKSLIATLDGFSRDEIDFSGIYVEMTDSLGHKYGPFSSQLNDAIRELDAVVLWLLVSLEDRGLDQDVNIIIVADHGMTDVSPQRLINASSLMPDLKNSVTQYSSAGPLLGLWPKPGLEDWVYYNLLWTHPNMTAYKKCETPPNWYYCKNPRIPPIIGVADLGYFVVPGWMGGFPSYPGTGPMKGDHGYDRTLYEMQAIFLATGPDFKVGIDVANFPNVELYQLFCYLLDIKPEPHNGTWGYVADMLRNNDGMSFYFTLTETSDVRMMLFAAGGVALIFVIVSLARRLSY